jgi:hypothetical protein
MNGSYSKILDGSNRRPGFHDQDDRYWLTTTEIREGIRTSTEHFLE